jgi:hypothetical protein
MSRKIGAGHLSAMARLGLRELREAVNPSKESVAREELGLFGTLTPGEIEKQKELAEQSETLTEEKDSRLRELHSLMSQPPIRPPPSQSNDLTR